jgi:hypothetical protein
LDVSKRGTRDESIKKMKIYIEEENSTKKCHLKGKYSNIFNTM